MANEVRITELPDCGSILDGDYLAVDAHTDNGMIITSKATASQIKEYIFNNDVNKDKQDVKFREIEITDIATVPVPEFDSNDTRVANTKWVKTIIADATSTSGMTANCAVVTDENNKIISSKVTSNELEHLEGLKQNVEEQLNLKATSNNPTFTGNITTALSNNCAVVTSSNGVLAASTATSTEVSYLSGVTSNIQKQLDTKSTQNNPVFTGTITTPLSGDKVVITTSDNKLGTSRVTSTELSYLSGTTKAVQEQLNNKLALKPTIINFTSTSGSPTISANPTGNLDMTTCTLGISSKIAKSPAVSANDLSIATTDYVYNKIIAMREPLKRRMYRCFEVLNATYSNRLWPSSYCSSKEINSLTWTMDLDSEIYFEYRGETSSNFDGADLIALFPGDTVWRVIASNSCPYGISADACVYYRPLIYNGFMPKGTKLRLQCAGSHPYANWVSDHYFNPSYMQWLRFYMYEFSNTKPTKYSPFEYDYDVSRGVYKTLCGKMYLSTFGRDTSVFGRATYDALSEIWFCATGANATCTVKLNNNLQCLLFNNHERYMVSSFKANTCAGDYIHLGHEYRDRDAGGNGSFKNGAVTLNNGSIFQAVYRGQLTPTSVNPIYTCVSNSYATGKNVHTFSTPGTGLYRMEIVSHGGNNGTSLRSVSIVRNGQEICIGYANFAYWAPQANCFFVNLIAGDVIKIGSKSLIHDAAQIGTDTRTTNVVYCTFYSVKIDSKDTVDKATITWNSYYFDYISSYKGYKNLSNIETYTFKANGLYDIYMWHRCNFNGVMETAIIGKDNIERGIGYTMSQGDRHSLTKYRVNVNAGEKLKFHGDRVYSTYEHQQEGLKDYSNYTSDYRLCIKKIR